MQRATGCGNRPGWRAVVLPLRGRPKQGKVPLNNNNRGNNRRRGRGNNRQGGGGGGQQLNRIDSRARGNAPQLLEKYRKLAHDAHLNGDRVQEEYYLQFADHYFRVIADTRVRQEEQRARREDRWEGGESNREDADDGGEFGGENEYSVYDSAPSYQTRREREERGEPRRREERRPRDEDRPDPRAQDSREEVREDRDDTGEEAAANPYEPVENPFVRDNRPTRGLKPRREDRRPRRDERQDETPAGLDPASLPPAIGAAAPEAEPEAGEEAPKPRRGRPRKKPADDAADESLQPVN